MHSKKKVLIKGMEVSDTPHINISVKTEKMLIINSRDGRWTIVNCKDIMLNIDYYWKLESYIYNNNFQELYVFDEFKEQLMRAVVMKNRK
jgi:hypothetical protein